ncbi:UDP-forming cellulose synthase catalytic subunit [Nodosilinea sp. P-1105]|uniref:UDP-forming cellulose synthase catalytic subunit n=1 Tax=Nodosilinea sp. P-1105 TaxID=2546229 RepID=UPI00146F26AC|nr:UDP-forming cellulose synthase catalytic subunit [Nodosilinea sp. P-1105]NMF84775.1 UDP-forming cellulose synthase catalytic subunit [Nodosilinea sp. P-1105]
MLHPNPAPPLMHWLTKTLPDRMEALTRFLGRRQLLLLLLCLGLLARPLVMVQLAIWQQGLVAVLLIGLGYGILQLEDAHAQTSTTRERLHLLMVVLSVLTTVRYLYYRTVYTLNFATPLDGTFSLLLYGAELYALGTLFLSYFQTLRLRDRTPISLQTIPPEQWPTVDVYIPTYDEDVGIVRKTVLAAVAIDYPRAKKQVYVLDDGRKYPERRAALAAMCEELGATLLTRDNNDHAKAGNINCALGRTHGDLVLILDCDHMPVRGFLQDTVGFFTDPLVALVQTPHWFYNPDPFERNLLTQGQVPVGNELFYKVLQKGNDAWNATFFCGSAAVVRRSYLLEVGGIATETVTEDCHTSLRLHSQGYRTIYYDKIMVAGLAPEKFAAYVGQQVRWARGMAQILRLENPLFNRRLNLSWAQRICYFSATSHFFFGFPRLMYAIAPALFLLFSINSVKGLGVETLLYALPHIVLSMQANHIPYKRVRFSFWNEIYEFAMSFQAGIVTLLALINPGLGQFNVTAKGLTVNQRTFDTHSVRYLLVLGVLTAASLVAVPFWLLLSPEDTQAVLINALWCSFNLVLVSSACLVALEQPQLRRAHRLPRQLTAIIHSEGRSWPGQTINVSESGAQVRLDEWPNVADQVWVELVGDYDGRALLEAHIVRATATSRLETELFLDFINVSPSQADDLVLVLYSDVQQWYSQNRSQVDKPLRSLTFIATSLWRVFTDFQPADEVKVRKQVNAEVHLTWEGWHHDSYPAWVVEMGTGDLRLAVQGLAELDQATLAETFPTVGLLFPPRGELSVAQSLVAQVTQATTLPHPNPEQTKLLLELSFPEALAHQQQRKIKTILRTLT